MPMKKRFPSPPVKTPAEESKPAHTSGNLPRSKADFLAWELDQPDRYEFIGGPVSFIEPSQVRIDMAYQLKTLLHDDLVHEHFHIREPYTRLNLGDCIIRPDLVVTREYGRPDPCSNPVIIFWIDGPWRTETQKRAAIEHYTSTEGLMSVVTLREDRVAVHETLLWGGTTPRSVATGIAGRLSLPEIYADISLRDVYDGFIRSTAIA